MLLSHNTILAILPSEISLLDFYLNQPHQDPEWVEFVRQRLQSPRLSPTEYEVMVRDFLNTELCFASREQICSLYQIIFYGREDPESFIDPIDLEGILHLSLEKIEFNHSALSHVFFSLFHERHDSPFYSDVKSSQAEHFRGFLEQKRQAQLARQAREELIAEWESISRRSASLEEENANLRQKLFLLNR